MAIDVILITEVTLLAIFFIRYGESTVDSTFESSLMLFYINEPNELIIMDALKLLNG